MGGGEQQQQRIPVSAMQHFANAQHTCTVDHTVSVHCRLEIKACDTKSHLQVLSVGKNIKAMPGAVCQLVKP